MLHYRTIREGVTTKLSGVGEGDEVSFPLPFPREEFLEFASVPVIVLDDMEIDVELDSVVGIVLVGLDKGRRGKIASQGIEILLLLHEVVRQVVDVLVFDALVEDALLSREEVGQRKIGFLPVPFGFLLDLEDLLEHLGMVLGVEG